MAQKTSTKARPKKAEPKVEQSCVHHWIIEPPDGPFSKGECRLCGEHREFRNHVLYSKWDTENSPYSKFGGINVDD